MLESDPLAPKKPKLIVEIPRTTAENTPSAAPVRLPTGRRARMAETCFSRTAKNSLDNYEFYVTVGFYDDCPSIPGEVFIIISKEGSTLNGCMDAIAYTISLALQYGVPWSVMHEKYSNMKFDPLGKSARWGTQYSSLLHAIADTISHLIEVQELNEDS